MEVKKGQKVWLSKYALTEGIEETAAQSECIDDQYIKVEARQWYIYKLGRDVHLSREGAAKEAEAMRKKKIASLQKQIQKLEALKF